MAAGGRLAIRSASGPKGCVVKLATSRAKVVGVADRLIRPQLDECVGDPSGIGRQIPHAVPQGRPFDPRRARPESLARSAATNRPPLSSRPATRQSKPSRNRLEDRTAARPADRHLIRATVPSGRSQPLRPYGLGAGPTQRRPATTQHRISLGLREGLSWASVHMYEDFYYELSQRVARIKFGRAGLRQAR
jgi:hypothetical protein